MFVINRMTKNPMTVTADTKVDEVAHLMKKHNFRRLPVVDDGKLVGFLSDSDLMRVAPSPATTLSRYEINYSVTCKNLRSRYHEKRCCFCKCRCNY